jgi:hypothetical protein
MEERNGWDTDEGRVSGVSSLVIGGGLLIGAMVATIKYISKKRRGLYGGIAPALDRPGLWVYGRF